MAVPQIANVYPARAHTMGSRIVRLLGLDFAPQVEVRFGSVVGIDPTVANHATLYVRVPGSATGPGLVDVTVQNLDADGLPIAGELATLTEGFAYARVALTSDSVLTRVTRAFIQMLQNETIENVSTAHSHTDYDAATGDAYDLTEVQTLPALVVVGPEVQEPEEQAEQQVLTSAFGYQVIAKGPYSADLRFVITGLGNLQAQTMNLQALVLAVFHQHPWVEVLRDPDDLSKGTIRFGLDLEAGGAPSIALPSDENNVRSFTVNALIRNVPLGELVGFEDDGAGATAVIPPVGDCGVELTFTKL